MVQMNDSPNLRLTLAAVGVALLIGCTTSPWKSEFHPSTTPLAATPRPADAPVRVREVPWERIQTTLRKLNDDRAASDIHPDDWDQQKKDAAKAELLRGLQVSEDPSAVVILGRTDFRTTDKMPRPTDDKELAAFARSIGATTVIWSDSYLGKADVTRYEPVTEWRTGSWDRWGNNGGSRSFSESSTIWVPLVIQADERAFMAYFLRDASSVTASR